MSVASLAPVPIARRYAYRGPLCGEVDNEPVITPEEMLHIGDDPQNDYLAATKCGMNALLFDPKGGGAEEDDAAAYADVD